MRLGSTQLATLDAMAEAAGTREAERLADEARSMSGICAVSGSSSKTRPTTGRSGDSLGADLPR